MYPEPIEHYERPGTLAEVLSLLARHGAGARILAGGQSLMPQLKARALAPRALIDINRVSELAACESGAEGFRCGALLRFAAAATHPDLCARWTALAEAAAAIGDRQVRNRGTLLGSIVFAAHWGDIAPAAAALGARVHMAGPAGGRELPLESFVLGPGRTALAPSELAIALSLPQAPPQTGSSYLKHGRATQDRATLAVAACLTREAGGSCTDLRLVVGGLARHPIARATAVEDLVRRQRPDAGLLREAGRVAQATLATQSDELASADYRAQLLGVYLPRALELAWTRAAKGLA